MGGTAYAAAADAVSAPTVPRTRSHRRMLVGASAVFLAVLAVTVGYVAGTSPGSPSQQATAVASTARGDDQFALRIATLEADLRGLRRGDGTIAPDFAYRIAMLERRLAETSDRVRSLRSTGGAIPGVIALDHLRRRVDLGVPYADQLATARAFLPDTPDTAPAAAILHAHSGRGVPTVVDLLESFGRIEPLIATQASRSVGIDMMLERFWHDAMHLIGFAEERMANPLLSGMAAVRRALERGQLAAAVDAATAMERELGPIITGWLSIARARLVVERSLEALERVSWQAMLAQRS